nr:polyprenyl synthetase family protein [Parabacteroides sp. FAFU027]
MLVNSEIDNINFDKQPAGLYQPAQYALSLGGKRVRPILALMACNLYSDTPQQAMQPAIGIEIFHNFTLLHDDVMDKADIRRGKPTVHKVWSPNTAILSGDAMQIIAYQWVAQCPSAHLAEVINLFSQTALEICEGQQYDMDFENRDDVTVDEYLEMIRLKTAVLLACALKTGAIIGGASDKDADLLYEFGEKIGLAFQLKDDLLDVYGDPAKFGKAIGGDITCNKKTFMLIKSLELANPQQKGQFEAWLNKTDFDREEKVAAITALYNEVGIKALCEEKINEYYQQSIAALNGLNVTSERKAELLSLADKLMYRES